MKLVTVEEMKRLERKADASGHSYAAMMERAGRAVAEAIRRQVDLAGKRVLVLVGPGNNGGDGLVAARYLSQAGAQVVCYLWKPRPDDDPNLKLVKSRGIHCLQDSKPLPNALRNADVIVDALLGTGVSRPIGGSLKELLDTVREVVRERRNSTDDTLTSLRPALDSHPPAMPTPLIVAVDVPSGLNCDTGAVDPATIPADLTVTFAAAKRGQFIFPGASILGELIVADIGIAPSLVADIPVEVADPRTIRAMLPARPLDAHKGTFGRAMIVAGSVNYTGAPYLAAAAAARVGAGLVTLAPPQPLHPILATRLSEATFLLLPHDMGVLTTDAIRLLAPALKRYAALLLGPGLGREKETVAFVHQLLGVSSRNAPRRIGFHREKEHAEREIELPPLVVDADGLNALAEAEEWWQALPENSVLTPHPGEMARLAGSDAKSVNRDRLSIARARATEWRQVVVLKGAHTIVAAPDGRAMVIPFANPALATAGTGDVLAGSIVGLLAQGLTPFAAAVCGAYLHALAGEIVARHTGDAGMLASDLLPALPHAIRQLKSGLQT